MMYNLSISAYSCTSDSTQYKRIGNSADLQFKASTKNGQSLPILVYNFIISPNGTSMLLAKYKIVSNTLIIDCKGCTFTGNVTTGNLTIRLDNLEKSNGGTYKHAVHTFDNVLRCVHVYILGKIKKLILIILEISVYMFISSEHYVLKVSLCYRSLSVMRLVRKIR